MNSEAVQESAHDTLAKVAELISVYDDRKVLIVGHTDAVGDAAYNKQLSERRAELVKQFFVDNFEVEEDRLSTQGFGEARPIAPDATGRSARQSPRGIPDPELTWRPLSAAGLFGVSGASECRGGYYAIGICVRICSAIVADLS
jgi:OOP family OmpA-OmpF porin